MTDVEREATGAKGGKVEVASGCEVARKTRMFSQIIT